MFHLLPPKPISNPVVLNFRNSLSQYNELNFQTQPLYIKRDAFQEAASHKVPETKPESKHVLKSVTNQRKSINAATKSKPQTIPESLPAQPQIQVQSKPQPQPQPQIVGIVQCRQCSWLFPDAMLSEDRDLHMIRCKNGYGEQDQMVWIKCRGNRTDYRYVSLMHFYISRELIYEDLLVEAE